MAALCSAALACSSTTTTGSGATSTGGNGGTPGAGGTPDGGGTNQGGTATGQGGIGGSGGSSGGEGGSAGPGGAGGGGVSDPTFQTLDQDVWLIGWAGGLDHFSWLRFEFVSDNGGTYDLIDAQGFTLTPYYPCTGSGSFSADPQTDTLTLQLPSACNGSSVLRVEGFANPQGYPPHAILNANLTELMTMKPLSGHQHQASFCDAGFTSCGDPFQP